MMVVGKRARMGGSEIFWDGEYYGGGDLSEKVVFWQEIVDKAGDFEGFGFRQFERRSAVRNGGKDSTDGEELIGGGDDG